jgi:pyridoxine kinase
MGMQVVPLPTAILSTHGLYKGFRKYDLSGQMEDFITHWKELGLTFDAMYSGYLGSEQQISIVSGFFHDFSQKNQWVVVDPVLGDNGKLYGSVHKGMVKGMRDLIRQAKLITPNLTEVSLLLDRQYRTDYSMREVKELLLGLSALGPDIVVITSLPVTGFPGQTSVVAYDRSNEKFWKVVCQYLPAEYPGPGDAFTSVLLGALMQGDSLPIALDRAVQFISLAVRATFGYGHDPREGIMLERVLGSLNGPVQLSSYELIE